MPSKCVRECVEEDLDGEVCVRWVVYCAFLFSFTRSAAFGCIRPCCLFCVRMCVRERVFVNLFCTNIHLYSIRPLAAHRLILLRTTTRPISCHCACGRSCVPSENNNRVGWQTGSVYLGGLNRLITSSDNDRTD